MQDPVQKSVVFPERVKSCNLYRVTGLYSLSILKESKSQRVKSCNPWWHDIYCSPCIVTSSATKSFTHISFFFFGYDHMVYNLFFQHRSIFHLWFMLLKNSDRDFLLLGSNSIIILTKFRLLLVRLIVHHYWVGMSVRSQPLLLKANNLHWRTKW